MRTRPHTAATPPPPDAAAAGAPAPAPAAAITIPSSLADAAAQATAAARLAFSRGVRRAFIEVDLSNGDATYTLLKSTLPLIELLLPMLDDAPGDAAQRVVHVVLPDAGAAALARRDLAALPAHVAISGLEQVDVAKCAEGADAGVIIVAPRASDVARLCAVVDAADDARVVVVNPDLVDMGVTGLSLNARMLRKRLVDTFESAYYLKTFGWGVLLRAYPGRWGIWVDEEGSEIGFRLVGEVEQRPAGDKIDEVLDGDERARGTGSGPLDKVWRFLSLYMKG